MSVAEEGGSSAAVSAAEGGDSSAKRASQTMTIDRETVDVIKFSW
jgi:hypothetical protein